jgi:CPA2 family monovalent cation:H+ antiporter-2
MEIPLLNDIVVIFALSIAVLFLCSRLSVPSIVGFILTGVLAGPHGLRLVRSVDEVKALAEVGVVLLLFAIGIEFSLKSLLQIRKSVLMGGSLQVLLTIVTASVIADQFGQPIGKAIFIGFLISLSSTAIVLKLIQERAEVDSPHGRTSLAILIFQDVIIVPMILLTPLLAGESGGSGGSLLILLAKGIAIIVLVVVSAKWVVPWVLYQIARTRSRELFLLSVFLICLAVAWMTSSAGLSLALGAFLAGLVISESEYGHQALGNISPFRDVFTSFFFVSIGMLFDGGFLFEHPVLILLITVAVMILKAILAGFSATLLGFPVRTAILVGFALSQVGEFSFILSETGVEHGLLQGNIYQMFLSVSVLTMAATPFVMALAPRVADFVSSLPLPARLKNGLHPAQGIKVESKKDHLVIIGFGVNGRNLARAARVGNIPYVIIEMNPEVVRNEKAKGEPIYYGDATQEAVLQHADIKYARIVVVAISDPAATRRITEIVRRLNPNVHLIVRTRYLQEMKPLYELGANEVVPEEFETSVEIFSRVLGKYLVPRDEIERFIAEVRSDGYEMFRSLSREPAASFPDLKLQIPGIEVSALRVEEKSPLVGKTLAQTDLRKKYGVTVVAIRRDLQILSNPDGDMQIRTGDVLLVLGSPDKIAAVSGLFYP